MNSNNWMGSFQQLEEPAPQPVFNLLPNGRRKKSFRAKIRTFSPEEVTNTIDEQLMPSIVKLRSLVILLPHPLQN